MARGVTGDVKKLQEILKASGFQFVRRESHEIWKSPKYGVFVVPGAHGSSDPRWLKNSLALLRRILSDQQEYREQRIPPRESPSGSRDRAKR